MRTPTASLLCTMITLGLTTLGAQEVTIDLLGDQPHVYGQALSLEVRIHNDGETPLRFTSADSPLFNIDLDVQTLQGQAVGRSSFFIDGRNRNASIPYQLLNLRPGESKVFTVELADFYDLTPGVHRVQLMYFPELHFSSAEPWTSNPIVVGITANVGERPLVLRTMDEATAQILQREKLPPDDVVRVFLEGRMRNQKEKYFLYLDIESLYLQQTMDSQAYNSMAERRKLAALEEFADRLWEQRETDAIGFIPGSYEIQSTTYTQDRGEVSVIQYYPYEQFIEVKEFVYEMVLTDGIWYIDGYSIRNLGNQ